MPAFERRLRRYTRPDLLILDELGYLPCDTRAADILYNIISRVDPPDQNSPTRLRQNSPAQLFSLDHGQRVLPDFSGRVEA